LVNLTKVRQQIVLAGLLRTTLAMVDRRPLIPLTRLRAGVKLQLLLRIVKPQGFCQAPDHSV
jgi:hypothetical protein